MGVSLKGAGRGGGGGGNWILFVWKQASIIVDGPQFLAVVHNEARASWQRPETGEAKSCTSSQLSWRPFRLSLSLSPVCFYLSLTSRTIKQSLSRENKTHHCLRNFRLCDVSWLRPPTRRLLFKSQQLFSFWATRWPFSCSQRASPPCWRWPVRQVTRNRSRLTIRTESGQLRQMRHQRASSVLAMVDGCSSTTTWSVPAVPGFFMKLHRWFPNGAFTMWMVEGRKKGNPYKAATLLGPRRWMLSYSDGHRLADCCRRSSVLHTKRHSMLTTRDHTSTGAVMTQWSTAVHPERMMRYGACCTRGQ